MNTSTQALYTSFPVDNETPHGVKRDGMTPPALSLGGAIALPARLIVFGAPRTKKTSNRILRFGRRKKVVPSAPYLTWRDAAVPQLRLAWAGRAPIAFPVNVAALFYRDAERGDAVGYYQGLADALQEGRVLENDRFAVSWDGSRLRKDGARARVEIEISNAN